MTQRRTDPAVELLAELAALGIQLEVDGERLRFRPRERVTAELAERMRAHKAELLVELEQRRKIRQQLTMLVPYQTADGRRCWVHPRHQRELVRLGLL